MTPPLPCSIGKLTPSAPSAIILEHPVSVLSRCLRSDRQRPDRPPYSRSRPATNSEKLDLRRPPQAWQAGDQIGPAGGFMPGVASSSRAIGQAKPRPWSSAVRPGRRETHRRRPHALTPAAAVPCRHCKCVRLANSWARSVKLRARDTGVSNPDATEASAEMLARLSAPDLRQHNARLPLKAVGEHHYFTGTEQTAGE
jgi:hypothetical protein